MPPQIRWIESYVTDDKVYCVYVVPNGDEVRKHAQQGGVPSPDLAGLVVLPISWSGVFGILMLLSE